MEQPFKEQPHALTPHGQWSFGQLMHAHVTALTQGLTTSDGEWFWWPQKSCFVGCALYSMIPSSHAIFLLPSTSNHCKMFFLLVMDGLYRIGCHHGVAWDYILLHINGEKFVLAFMDQNSPACGIYLYAIQRKWLGHT